MALLSKLKKEYIFQLIIGHSDIALVANDPSALFPWNTLMKMDFVWKDDI
jgi:N-acetyl-anhydromuramyl-L-alanine amidase AmpD